MQPHENPCRVLLGLHGNSTEDPILLRVYDLYPANKKTFCTTRHLNNICTISAPHLRRRSNIVQILYKCSVFAWYHRKKLYFTNKPLLRYFFCRQASVQSISWRELHIHHRAACPPCFGYDFRALIWLADSNDLRLFWFAVSMYPFQPRTNSPCAIAYRHVIE